MSGETEMSDSMVYAALNVMANNGFVTGDSAKAKFSVESRWRSVPCINGIKYEGFSYLVHPAIKFNFWLKRKCQMFILVSITWQGIGV